MGGVGGVRCAPAESLGSLARWPRARRDACLMRVPWWPHMGGARSASCGAPGDPEVAPGGQRWAGGTPRLRQGWAERPRRTFGPVLGAGARLAWYCSHTQKVGDLVEIVSPVYGRRWLERRTSSLWPSSITSLCVSVEHAGSTALSDLTLGPAVPIYLT